MTASYQRISDRSRGTGYKAELPEVGDRFTAQVIPEYGACIDWHRGQVSWLKSAGVTAEASNDIPPFDDESAWVTRTEHPSHTERHIVTALRFTATEPGQSVTLWTSVDVDPIGFSTDSAL